MKTYCVIDHTGMVISPEYFNLADALFGLPLNCIPMVIENGMARPPTPEEYTAASALITAGH